MGVMAPPMVGQRLDVQYISQLERPEADFADGDCGPACAVGFIHTCTGDTNVTVDDVAMLTPLADNDPDRQFTRANEIRTAALDFGVMFRRQRSSTLEDLQAALDDQRGVILRVYYKRLPERFDPNYDYGHWITLHGYDASGFFYHDPYWPLMPGPRQRGANLFLTRAQLQAAMQGGIHADVPLTGECLVLESHRLPPVAARSRSAGLASDNAAQGATLVGTVTLAGQPAADVVVQVSGEARIFGAVAGAVNAAAPDAVQWTYPLSGYSDDLYRAYQEFGADLMRWEQFVEKAAAANPALVKDGYELRPEQLYLMPEALITLTWSRPATGLSGTLDEVWQTWVLEPKLGLSYRDFAATFAEVNGIADPIVRLNPALVYLLPERVVSNPTVQWDKTVTGIEGTLDEVYNYNVAAQVPGLARGAFRRRVVQENPLLQTEDKTPRFYRSKSYQMPRADTVLTSYITARTDATGAFAVPNLPAGALRVTVKNAADDIEEERVTVPGEALRVELAPQIAAVAPAPAGRGLAGAQPVSPSFIRVDGQRFKVNDAPFRFVGVNTRGLVHWGDHSVLQYSFREQWDEQLGAARHVMGARVVRFFLPHYRVSVDETISRLRRLVGKLSLLDLYAVVVLTDVQSDTGHVVPGDLPFYTVQKGATMLNHAWYGGGFRQNYKPFVERVVTAFANEPRIMAWELGNELRAFDAVGQQPDQPLLIAFVREISARIAALDPNHLITTGFINSGSQGVGRSLGEIANFYQAMPEVDYLTVHFFENDDEEQRAEQDAEAARGALGMPLVVEETGFAPDSSRIEATRMLLDKWFDRRGAAGVMQSGFLGIPNNSDGDASRGLMVNQPGHFWPEVAAVYRNRAAQL